MKLLKEIKPRILRNRCQCRKCGDVIESRYRHHFVTCRCDEIFTDGGLDYVRRGYNNPNNVISMDQYTDHIFIYQR